jgi:hypothetical protein
VLPAPTNLSEFTERVRCLCAIHRASVTSWGRTNSRNAQVGGTSRSWHRLERGMMAVDVVLDLQQHPGQRRDLVSHARLLGFDAIDEGDHIHLEPKG